MNLYERIREMCAIRGITVSDLEVQAGLGKKTMYNWGTSAPAADKLQRVANILNCSMEYLLGENEEINNEDNEVIEIREQLRQQPGMRMLFNAAKGVTEDELQNVANMVAAFKKGN